MLRYIERKKKYIPFYRLSSSTYIQYGHHEVECIKLTLLQRKEKKYYAPCIPSLSGESTARPCFRVGYFFAHVASSDILSTGVPILRHTRGCAAFLREDTLTGMYTGSNPGFGPRPKARVNHCAMSGHVTARWRQRIRYFDE
jgi:hypothetical protein